MIRMQFFSALLGLCESEIGLIYAVLMMYAKFWWYTQGFEMIPLRKFQLLYGNLITNAGLGIGIPVVPCFVAFPMARWRTPQEKTLAAKKKRSPPKIVEVGAHFKEMLVRKVEVGAHSK